MATKKTTTKKTTNKTKSAKTAAVKKSPKAVAKTTKRCDAKACEPNYRAFFLAMVMACLLVANGALMVMIEMNNEAAATSGDNVTYTGPVDEE